MSRIQSSEALICPHCGHADADAATDSGPGTHRVECDSCGKLFQCSIEFRLTYRSWAETRRLDCRNTSGFRGVSRHKASGRWLANICHDGRTRHIGLYDSPEDAARAYDERAKKLRGGAAKLNFPKGRAR